MPHEDIAQYHGKMLGYLRKCRKLFSCLNDADLEDAVQTALADNFAKSEDFTPTVAAWGTYLCKAAEYAAKTIAKKRNRERELGWFQSLGSDLEADVKDSPALRAVDKYGATRRHCCGSRASGASAIAAQRHLAAIRTALRTAEHADSA